MRKERKDAPEIPLTDFTDVDPWLLHLLDSDTGSFGEKGQCLPNRIGDRYHDSETGHPCSPNPQEEGVEQKPAKSEFSLPEKIRSHQIQEIERNFGRVTGEITEAAKWTPDSVPVGDPKRVNLIRRVLASTLMASRFLLVSPLLEQIPKDLAALWKINVDLAKRMVKLARAMAGKEEYTKEDAKDLLSAVFELPRFAMSMTVGWGLPLSGPFMPFLYQNRWTKHFFAKVSQDPPDVLMSRLGEYMGRLARVPEKIAAGEEIDTEGLKPVSCGS